MVAVEEVLARVVLEGIIIIDFVIIILRNTIPHDKTMTTAEFAVSTIF